MLRWPSMQGGDEMQPPAAHKLTYDDFLCFPDDGRRHELIEGEHYVTPSPSERHQRVSLELSLALGSYLRSGRIGRLYYAPFDVVLSNHDVVEPDLLVVLSDQDRILTEQNVRGAPAIVVEILSPGTRRRDETLKRTLYARAGVREYWMIDPDRKTIVVCHQASSGGQGPAVALAAASGDVLTSLLLPGFSLALTSLFGPTTG